MATSFLSSEEYDERAHHLYNGGDYEGALATLKEGLRLYPHSVELYVGLGYTRLAREEFAWARQAFEKALVLDPENEDGVVGMGEVLLRFGQRDEALAHFRRAREGGARDDAELLLSMGRALFREKLLAEAREVFGEAVEAAPDNAEAVAALAYTLHRQGNEGAARRELRRSLRLDPEYHEARVYLGHMLYDRGDWRGALREFERVPPDDHWDTVAVWRVMELKRALRGLEHGHPELKAWAERLEELESDSDPIEELLVELEAQQLDDSQLDLFRHPENALHRVRLADGRAVVGSWLEIAEQLRELSGRPDETLSDFMQRRAHEERARTGAELQGSDPEGFLRACARAGLLVIEQ